MTGLNDKVQLTINVTQIRGSAIDNTFYRVVTLHIGDTRIDLSIPAIEELIAQLNIAAGFVDTVEMAAND
jgi:hypothetical protein